MKTNVYSFKWYVFCVNAPTKTTILFLVRLNVFYIDVTKMSYLIWIVAFVRHWNFTLRFRFGLFWENRKSSACEKWNDNKIKSVSISWYAESKYCLSPNIWSVHKLIAIYACMRCDHRSVVCLWCMVYAS